MPMRRKIYGDRKSSCARGYGYKWQIAREGFLKKHPLCMQCELIGKLTPAAVVDHIVPHRGDMGLFWSRENWQALCKQCHDSYKKRVELSGVDAGCDTSGLPIDTNHHWNR